MHILVLVLLLCCCSIHHSFFYTHGLKRVGQFGLAMGRAAFVRADTKTRQDEAKSTNYSKYARKIAAAIKRGGSTDLSSNSMLAMVVAEAKARNVPKDVIQRNIDKSKEGVIEDYEEFMFEYFGPGGCGLLVQVLTDNMNRARGDLNIVLKKHPLKPANSNAVACKFDYKARLDIPVVLEEDSLVELCVEHCVEDYQMYSEASSSPLSPLQEGHCSVFVKVKDMAALRNALAKIGIDAVASLQHVPNNGFVRLSKSDFDAAVSAVEALEGIDDVVNVEHNIELSPMS